MLSSVNKRGFRDGNSSIEDGNKTARREVEEIEARLWETLTYLILANISEVAVPVWRGLAHRGAAEERRIRCLEDSKRQSQVHCDNSSTRSVEV